MRLRYFRLIDTKPFGDLRVVFRQETILQRKCAIRFVVGVNGTGKSRLLQALTHTLLELERRRLPPFPVTLAYDLGLDDQERTLLLHVAQRGEGDSVLIEFDDVLDDMLAEEWDALAQNREMGPLFTTNIRAEFKSGDLPGVGSVAEYVPKVLLAYTSGALEPWQSLFKSEPAVSDTSVLPLLPADETEFEVERPANWTTTNEAQYRRSHDDEPLAAIEDIEDQQQETAESELPSVGQLVTPDVLPLAVCAVTLYQLVSELREGATRDSLRAAAGQASESGRRHAGLRGLLDEVGWLWPESIHLHIRIDPKWLEAPQNRPHVASLTAVYQAATSVVRQPGPVHNRLLNYDLFTPVHRSNETNADQSTAYALFESLAGELPKLVTAAGDVLVDEAGNALVVEGPTAYGVFKQLCAWQSVGLLESCTMTVRKQGVNDLLLYDWLSDGERMFLGRTALFHLLRGQDDALLLLDEPETHFNDVWKREIVDIIDDSLRDTASDVVISTHSSIALTDVFDTEVTLLRKNRTGTVAAAVRTPMHTFGALPNEIMWGIFDAPDVVGQRATEFLDMVLTVATFPEEVETIWGLPGGPAAWQQSEAFEVLWQKVQVLPHIYEDKMRLQNALEGLRNYTRDTRALDAVTAVSALEALRDRLGPGAYDFEFARRLRALRK